MSNFHTNVFEQYEIYVPYIIHFKYFTLESAIVSLSWKFIFFFIMNEQFTA